MAHSTESQYDNFDNISGNEILTLCIGQCGIFTGSEYYKTIMNEHKIGKDGKFVGNINKNNDKLLLSKINTYFNNESKTNRYIPRAMFIDIDKCSVNKIRSSCLGLLIKDNNMINSEYNEPSIIFPNGYYNEGADIIDDVMDKIRKEIEIFNYYQGINMIHSISGGFGAGFGSLLLSKLTDDYPKKHRLTHSIFPSSMGSYSWYGSRNAKMFAHHSGVHEAYNSMLSINHLIDNADLSMIINNAQLLNAVKMRCKLSNPTYHDINWLSSLILSGITTPFRFHSEPELNSNLKKMYSYFVVFPKLHFLTLSHSPFFSNKEYKFNEHIAKIVDESLSNDVSNINMEEGKFMSCSIMYRGNNVTAINKMNQFTATFHDMFCEDFVSWIPQNAQSSFICDGGFECYKMATPLMATTLMNHTAIKTVFQKISGLFGKAYRRKAFLWSYKREGMDQEEMIDADQNIRDLINDLQDKQDITVEIHDYDDDDDDDDDDDEDEEEEDF